MLQLGTGPEGPIRSHGVSFFRHQTKGGIDMEANPGSPDGVAHLTPRQKQIVMLIAEDLTAKQIAERLGISPKTVEFHRDLIKQHLKVVGTAGIVRHAIKAGLIQP
jgi:DNA-binding CsgD family transcriptional regulator